MEDLDLAEISSQMGDSESPLLDLCFKVFHFIKALLLQKFM